MTINSVDGVTPTTNYYSTDASTSISASSTTSISSTTDQLDISDEGFQMYYDAIKNKIQPTKTVASTEAQTLVQQKTM